MGRRIASVLAHEAVFRVMSSLRFSPVKTINFISRERNSLSIEMTSFDIASFWTSLMHPFFGQLEGWSVSLAPILRLSELGHDQVAFGWMSETAGFWPG